jgi:DNA-binding CsgD family transcriptional regulator
VSIHGPVIVNAPPERVGLAVDDERLRDAISTALAAAGIAPSSVDDPDIEQILAGLTLSSEFALPEFGDLRRPVVVCAPLAGPRAVRRAVERGIDGLVWETQIESRLVPTLRAVAVGQLVLPREIWRPTEQQELTNREKQTLSLVIMGLSNGEIASKLFVSESTVKSHLSSAFRKLGVRSRAEASRVIADPRGGLGTGILSITPTRSSGGSSKR